MFVEHARVVNLSQALHLLNVEVVVDQASKLSDKVLSSSNKLVAIVKVRAL